MAPKVFPYNFESFKGLNYRSTPLKTDIFYAKEAKNMQFGESYSLRSRPGCQLIAAPGGFVGMSRFAYTDLATNLPTEELLAINDNLWKLNVYTQAIGRTAPVAWGYRIELLESLQYRFLITESGVAVGSGVSLFYGNEDAPVTVMDLCEAIDALANYTCTMSFERARVNGAQTGVNAITVDAGHTYAATDEIEFFDFSTMKLVSRIVSSTTATTITVNGPVVDVKNNQVLGAIASTPAACIPLNVLTEVNDSSKSFLFYYWTKVRESVTDSLSVGTSYAPFQNFFLGQHATNWINPCFVPTETDHFVCTEVPGTTIYEWENRPWKYDGKVCFRAGLHRPYRVTATDSGSAGNPDGTYRYKIQYEQSDAQGVITLGQPSEPSAPVTLTTNIVSVVGHNVQLDYRTESLIDDNPTTTRQATVNGNQVAVNAIAVLAHNAFVENDIVYFLDRATTTYVQRRVTAVTQLLITIEGTAVDVNDTDIIYRGFVGYNYKTGRVNGNQNNVSTVNVNGPQLGSFQVGERVFIRGNDGAGNIKYHDVVLNARTATTIAWDADTYGTVYVRSADNITAGLKIHIYRTKNGGGVYYHVDTLPNDITTPFFTYLDNKADTSLGAELIEPEIGKEWNPPPRAGIAALHQGAMVYSRIRGEGNSVAFSDSVGGLEAVPLASNYFSVPGSSSGVVTGLVSDNVDSLIVTKENAIYKVDGTLDVNAFSLTALKEGDYGISSHASIAKINGSIVGVGPLGFVEIRGGQVSIREEGGSEFGFLINPAIIGNNRIKLSQAIGYNDNLSRYYRCFIPDDKGFVEAAINSSSLFFVCDYEKRNVWFTREHEASILPGAGFCNAAIGPVNYLLYSSGDFPNYYVPHAYHLSRGYSNNGLTALNEVPGALYRELSSQYPETYRYVDHSTAYTSKLVTSFESLGDPDDEKEFDRVKVWSLPNEYEDTDAFTLTVKTYKNFKMTPRNSEFTLSFSSSDVYKTKELKLDKCWSMAFSFEALLQSNIASTTAGIFISGISISASLPYRKENIKK